MVNLKETNFPELGQKYEGKVRDNYSNNSRRVIIVTDRISAFDRVIGFIPYKGQVLNQMAAFWFEKTKDIVDNHMVSVPDPNVMVVREADPVLLEIIVREYMTGQTTTAIWHNYQKGVRNFCGNLLPEGLIKDQRLPSPIITPTTKAAHGDHDESITPKEAIARGLVTSEEMKKLSTIALKLFNRGKEIVAKQGIILVDTKYEFGRIEGKLVLIDEIHTPDSSRFWFAESYERIQKQGGEQKKIDKDYVRNHLASQGFNGDGPIPPISDEVIAEASRMYREAYERITGQKFIPAKSDDAIARIHANLIAAGLIKK